MRKEGVFNSIRRYKTVRLMNWYELELIFNNSQNFYFCNSSKLIKLNNVSGSLDVSKYSFLYSDLNTLINLFIRRKNISNYYRQYIRA